MNFIKQKKIVLTCFCIVVSLISYAQESINATFNSNKISISGGGINIKNCSFAVHLLVDEKPLTIYPQGSPEISVRERETPAGTGKEISYKWMDGEGYQCSWLVTSIGDKILSVRGEFINGTLKPVLLQKFELLSTPEHGFSVEGKASDWMLSSTDIEVRRWGTLDMNIPTDQELLKQKAYSIGYLRKSGDTIKSNNRAWRGYYDDFTLYKEPGKSGVTFAAVDSICDVYYYVKTGQTKMKLEVVGDMSEVLVESGESRVSDEVLLLFMPWDKAQVVKNKWIADVAKVKVTKKPVFGWCSWYRVGKKVTQEHIYDIAAYTKRNRGKIPFDVIQLDDGWQIGSFNWEVNEKFSRGFNDLIDSVNAAGAVAGIWLSPVKVNPVVTKRRQERRPFPAEWYVEYKIGTPMLDCLDPTHPEAREFIYNSIKNNYDLGFRYFKLDFSKIEYFTKRFYYPKMTRFQAQKELYRIYREAAGNDSYILSCGPSLQRFMVPYVDAARIGTDTQAKDGFAQSLATDGQPAGIHGFWYPIHSIVNKSYENGVLSNGDPDVSFVAQLNKCSPAQLQTFHSFVGIYGGIAMISDLLYEKDFDNQDNLRMMEILHPVSKEKGHPFAGGWDIDGKEFGYVAKCQYGNFANVIIWNPEHSGTADLTIKNVPTDELGRKFHAWSFWDEKYIGIVDKNYVAKEVPHYEHQLLRLTPLNSQPVLIGSNLHVSMGATEVKDIRCTSSHINIEMDPNAGSRDGRLYFYSEKPLMNSKSTNSESFIVKQGKNLYSLVLLNRIQDKKELITIEIEGKTPVLEKGQLTGTVLQKYNQSSFTPAWKVSW